MLSVLLALLKGFEPSTCRLGGGRSILLSYSNKRLIYFTTARRLCQEVRCGFKFYFPRRSKRIAPPSIGLALMANIAATPIT